MIASISVSHIHVYTHRHTIFCRCVFIAAVISIVIVIDTVMIVVDTPKSPDTLEVLGLGFRAAHQLKPPPARPWPKV